MFVLQSQGKVFLCVKSLNSFMIPLFVSKCTLKYNRDKNKLGSNCILKDRFIKYIYSK